MPFHAGGLQAIPTCHCFAAYSGCEQSHGWSLSSASPVPSCAAGVSTTACFPVPSDAAGSTSTAAADAKLLPATAAAAADDGPAGSNAAEDGSSSSSAKTTGYSTTTAPGPAKCSPANTTAGTSGKSLAE